MLKNIIYIAITTVIGGKMAKKDVTTIQISKDVREQLRKLGKMGETYDDVIKKLMNS